ncbi:MAG: hypothetical protein CBC79_04910 [Gammaproteobacteria bacterium TMED119]|nr:MAG: hypothetical protein CBC79_04910 [Gammaproteobacteria bacterium TMED119]
MIKLILKKPLLTLSIIIAVIAGLSPYLQNISVDASPDSLLLESDPDLKFYREVHSEYGTDEFIVVGFKPDEDLFAPASIAYVSQLTETLLAIDKIDNVTSIATVPLLQQARRMDAEGVSHFKLLNDEDIDINLVRKEFTNSALYASNLVSSTGKATAIIANIKMNTALDSLLQQKYSLLEQLQQRADDDALLAAMESLNEQLLVQRNITGKDYELALQQIRQVINQQGDAGVFYLAGAPLISNDIKTFIKNDIIVFGISILAIMFIVLYLFFRRLSWVLLSLGCAFLNVMLVAGLIGLLELQLTLISANFVALLIIFSITLSIHVIIRYQEICSLNPDSDNNIVVALQQIFTPCSYMIATSAIAFLSLIASDIQPVIYFGLIMVLGLICAFTITFTALPALIKLIKPKIIDFKSDRSSSLLNSLLNIILVNQRMTSMVLLAIVVFSTFGITQITVENRFIDYFKSNTDIHQGLVFVDQELGGTVPLEIMLDAPPVSDDQEWLEDDEFSDYLDEEEDSFTQQSYWYNRQGINKIQAIHEYLESHKQVGKVLSIHSTAEVMREVANGETLEDFHLALIYNMVSAEIKDILINPYISSNGDQARIVARIKDSDHSLIRNELLTQINNDINENLLAEGETVRLTGISVLYNNVLQSLYQSQILTLSTVFVCILVMLLFLFRSIPLALIGTIPNVFTALFILGSMGLFKIPLDIMTITIAAITIGIGVDYAIHYIHRYRKEIQADADHSAAIHTVQTTVGKALYYTSITITLGFVVLVSSNFMPSIYFGMFTSLAMVISLLATFTIIPILLNTFRPNLK